MNKKIDQILDIYDIDKSEEIINYYKKWAKNFDCDMLEWNYQAPEIASKLLDSYLNDKNTKILDAGCGTGLVGQILKKLGHQNIDGIDFSQAMLDKIPNNLYKTLKKADLNKKININTLTYDSIICVGTFTYGHVRPHALSELIRITKINGYICFTVNEGVYNKYGFNKKILELENNKIWKILRNEKSKYLVNKNVECWLCIAQKIK